MPLYYTEEQRDEAETPLATPRGACLEYARNVGAEDQSRAWILTNWDTWEPNPFYVGPVVRHPEDYDAEDGQ